MRLIFVRMAGGGFAAAAAVLIASPSAPAAPPRLEIEPGDRALRIVAFAGDRRNFHTSLGVQAVGRVRGFDFIATDLKREGGDERISRRAVVLLSADGKRPAKRTIAAGRFRLYRVAVRYAPMPGTYRGQVRLVLGPRRRYTLPLEAVIKPLNIAPSAQAIHVRVAHCPRVPWVDCGWFRHIVPTRWFDDDRRLALVTSPSAPVTVRDAEALLVDDDGDRLATDVVDVKFKKPTRFEQARVIEVPVRIKREQLPPGQYAGTVLLQVQGAVEPVRVTLDLNVRPEPVVPLLLILVGIVLGRTLRRLQVETPASGVAAAAAAAPAVAPAAPAPASTGPQSLSSHIIEFLSGVPRVAPSWGARALLGLLLIVLLTAFGFHTLYGKAATGFGAGALGDYLTLVAWGLSAEVASRTIATFRGASVA